MISSEGIQRIYMAAFSHLHVPTDHHLHISAPISVFYSSHLPPELQICFQQSMNLFTKKNHKFLQLNTVCCTHHLPATLTPTPVMPATHFLGLPVAPALDTWALPYILPMSFPYLLPKPLPRKYPLLTSTLPTPAQTVSTSSETAAVTSHLVVSFTHSPKSIQKNTSKCNFGYYRICHNIFHLL